MTLDEARLMANVNGRSQRLFADGYRARWEDRKTLAVRSPRGASYQVDVEAGTCSCPFYGGHEGRLPCKHLLGWGALLARQRERRLLVSYALLRAWASLDDGSRLRVGHICQGEEVPCGREDE